jgi:hypothetical protein
LQAFRAQGDSIRSFILNNPGNPVYSPFSSEYGFNVPDSTHQAWARLRYAGGSISGSLAVVNTWS